MKKKKKLEKNKIIYNSSTTGLPILFSEITKPPKSPDPKPPEFKNSFDIMPECL